MTRIVQVATTSVEHIHAACEAEVTVCYELATNN